MVYQMVPQRWCKGDVGILIVNVRTGDEAVHNLEFTSSVFHVSMRPGEPWWRFTLRDGRGLGIAREWWIVAECETPLETIARARAQQPHENDETPVAPASAPRLRKTQPSPERALLAVNSLNVRRRA